MVVLGAHCHCYNQIFSGLVKLRVAAFWLRRCSPEYVWGDGLEEDFDVLVVVMVVTGVEASCLFIYAALLTKSWAWKNGHS